MPTYDQLIDSSPNRLGEASTGLRNAKEELTSVVESFDKAVRATDAVWQGQAKQAHDAAADRLHGQVSGVGDNFSRTSMIVRQAAQALHAVVEALQRTESSAKQAGFQVFRGPMALVWLGPRQQQQVASAGPAAPAVFAAYQAVAQAYTMMLGMMVAQATALDASFGAQITGIGATLAASSAALTRGPASDPAFSPDLNPGDVRLGDVLPFTEPDESRATGGEAYLTPDMIRRGPKPGVPEEIVPAGYRGAAGPHAKSHVIADVLGGPLEDERNYATLFSRNFQRANDGPMARLERRVKAVVDGRADGIPQQNVRYRVDMEGAGRLPDGVRIHLVGDRGYRESIYLPNM